MTTTVLPHAPQVRSASLLVAVDPVEDARRRTAGLGAVTDMAALELLLTLPEGFPVPVASLPDRDRRALKRLPAGVVEASGGEVVRLAVKPLRAVLATVRGTCSETALGKASSFAPFCARRVLTRVRPEFPETLIEFGFYGVGVTYRAADGAEETLVEPRPWRPMRHTPAGWRFIEQAYEQYRQEAP
jgi:hypothetical protein